MAPKFFYGYVILGLCFINMVVMRGVNGAFGVYYLALLEEFCWSRSDGASIASINFVVYALAAPVVGFAFDRFGPRLLMPLGAALGRCRLAAFFFFHFAIASSLFLRRGHGLGPRSARFRRPQRADFVLVRAPARHRHRHRFHGPRLGRARDGAGDADADQLHRLALDLYRHRQSLVACFWCRPTRSFSAARRKMSANFPTATRRRRRCRSRRHAANRQAQRDWTLGEAARSFPFWCITDRSSSARHRAIHDQYPRDRALCRRRL